MICFVMVFNCFCRGVICCDRELMGIWVVMDVGCKKRGKGWVMVLLGVIVLVFELYDVVFVEIVV